MAHREAVMKKFVLVAVSLACAGCGSSLKEKQEALVSQIRSPLLVKLYVTDLYGVFYDKASKQCVMYAYVHSQGNQGGSEGVGIGTFACNPEEVKKVADANPFPAESSGGLKGLFK
jgi:hypothetical protein